MMNAIDRWLDRVTMYRLVEYVLLAYVGIAAVLGWMGKVPYDGTAVLVTTALVVLVAWIGNHIFARTFEAPVHSESAIITGLILALLVPPYRQPGDLGLIFWAPALAISAKYMLAWHKQHIWNPAAIAAVLTAMVLQQPVIWWVGSAWMLPFVAVGGFLIVKKLRRWEVVLTFLGVALVGMIIAGWMRHTALADTLHRALLVSPLIFFSTIMLTEPLTMPPRRGWRILYAVVIGILYIPQLKLGPTYSTPELALALGNILFFIFVGRGRYVLKLRQKIQVAPLTYDFVFDAIDRPQWYPGQYFEWTLTHPRSDQRGQRRYFTVASSPTERGIRLGVKFAPDRSSSFKQALLKLHPGQAIVAGQRDGDFTLPTNEREKIVFIAGGIGVTPFRSMTQWLLDKKQTRDVTLFYCANSAEEFVYTDIFSEAQKAFGLRPYYVITNKKSLPPNWQGLTGFLTPEIVQQYVPDYGERTFYLSGPQAMVKNYVSLLKRLGLPSSQIKTDYFPGFA